MRRLSIGCALVLLAGAPALAQTPPDQRWTPWLGCWSLVLDARKVAPDADAPRVCVAPAPGGATFTTMVGDKVALTQTIVADGTDRAVDEAGCTGTQRGVWSATGLRLFAHAALTCAGDAAPRRVSGLALLIQDGTWLDIQAVAMENTDTVRVRRFRRTDAATSAVPLLGRSLSLADIKEAAGQVSPAAIEAAIVEARARLPLSSRALLDLDQADVPDRVIDLMIAVAYPDRFEVQRSRRTDTGPVPSLMDLGPFGWQGWRGLGGWGGYGLYDYYGSPFGYSPFAYPYYGRFDARFGGPVIVVGEGGGGGGVQAPQSSGRGRVVDGQGYTRVRPREESEPTRSGTTSATTSGSASAPPADASSSSSSSSSSGSSSSGSASPAGFSSGGGGGDGGRTAVPR